MYSLARLSSLNKVIQDLCKYWGIEGSSDGFGLKFDQTDEYVTETSKKNIKV
jgi:hypothetical protein